MKISGNQEAKKNETSRTRTRSRVSRDYLPAYTPVPTALLWNTLESTCDGARVALLDQGRGDPEMDCLLIKYLTTPVGRIPEAVYLKRVSPIPSHRRSQRQSSIQTESFGRQKPDHRAESSAPIGISVIRIGQGLQPRAPAYSRILYR